ncbi:MAG TPA: hypothetical protein VGK30_08860 [Candidatus Binatia bacterium]|jgi:hypothetical protein
MPSMMSAIEKLADRLQPTQRRHVVCHRCSVECSVPRDQALEDVACIGCLRRLVTPAPGDAAAAIAAVADWWDKSAAPGPGYGAVDCPYCGAACVVEVGRAARTGCVTCVRPLGASPLVRVDLAAQRGGHERRTPTDAADRHGVPDRLDMLERLGGVAAAPCLMFPGEPL